MGLFTRDIKTMEDLFLHGLQDIYYAENQIVKSLPSMIDKAKNRQLSAALRAHLRETQNQVARLDKLFERLDHSSKGADCPAIVGLIEEATAVAGEVDNDKVMDAAIISSSQAIEHYEISRYGTLIAWAKELGHSNVVPLLNANLKEEKAADRKLNGLAAGKVNARATGRATASRRASASSRKKRATSKGRKSRATKNTSSARKRSSGR